MAWKMLSTSSRLPDVVRPEVADEVMVNECDAAGEADKATPDVADAPAVVLMSPSCVSFQAELPMTDPRSTFPSGEAKPSPRAMK